MTKIKVIGIGGSGGNAVSRMKKAKIQGVELVAINTDYQDLKKTKADFKLQIGKKLTQGLGTGMKPEIGELAAKENREEIRQILKGGDLDFITYGAGGGTGSGAGPVVAEIAKKLGALTIAVVTKPFYFEGQTRMEIAKAGIERLKKNVDSLICVENDKLLEILTPQTPITSAFWFCDDILREAVRGISDLITIPGIININFADIKAILRNSGTAIFGIGRAKGEKRGEISAKSALNSPLLGLTPKGAKGVLFNVSGSDISLSEIEEIGKILTREINPEAKVIFGASQGSPDEKLGKGEIKVTLIATGF
jgi:cell division protein FtsZ